MNPVVLLPEAQKDLSRGARYLERRTRGVGDRLVSEVDDALQRLADNPRIGPETSPGTRSLVLRQFPYTIVYRLVAERVFVLAIAHHRRRPDYWQDHA